MQAPQGPAPPGTSKYAYYCIYRIMSFSYLESRIGTRLQVCGLTLRAMFAAIGGSQAACPRRTYVKSEPPSTFRCAPVM